MSSDHERYAAYKDSGVEWIGEIPAGWDVVPIKYLASCNDEVLSEATDSGQILNYIDIASVSPGSIDKIEPYEFKDAPSRARRIVQRGDVIVSTVRTYLKAIAPIDPQHEDCIVSTGFAVLRPHAISGAISSTRSWTTTLPLRSNRTLWVSVTLRSTRRC